ncbi:MAG: histidine kinase [Prolixibacteraceae bacterium]|nr:histidine kinase [Prolixibacteraceae bacterium]
MNRIIKIILHLFYWMVFSLFSGLVSFQFAKGFDFVLEHLDIYLYNSLWAVIQFYLFYFLFYQFIERQKYIRYFIYSVAVSIGLSLVMFFFFNLLFDFPALNEMRSIIPPIVGTFIIGNSGSLLRGFIGWFEDIQRKQEMEKMIIRNELDMLNSQLNPHFLFNTLNNIDSLIFRQPQKASESLITLSEIMRYMLYEARQPKVSINQEIVHYRNIIRLQGLRFSSPETIRFEAETGFGNQEVAPLLFLPFIENAFKYAVNTGVLPMIDFKLNCTENEICWTSRNSFLPVDTSVSQKTGGIGLSNLKRRLELLYPERYSLKTEITGNEFFAELKLHL